MTEDEARQLAAHCWCDPETSSIILEPRLVEAFSRRILILSSKIDSLVKEIIDLRVEKERHFVRAEFATRTVRDLTELLRQARERMLGEVTIAKSAAKE